MYIERERLIIMIIVIIIIIVIIYIHTYTHSGHIGARPCVFFGHCLTRNASRAYIKYINFK